MRKFFRRINGKLAWFIIALTLFINAGVVYGMTQLPEISEIGGTIPWVLAGGITIQAISLAVWVGTTKSDIKFIKEAVKQSAKDRVIDRKDITENKLGVGANKLIVDSLQKDVKKIEDIQTGCKWFNRNPREFKTKNGE